MRSVAPAVLLLLVTGFGLSCAPEDGSGTGNPAADPGADREDGLPLGVAVVSIGERRCVLVSNLEEGWSSARWLGSPEDSKGETRVQLRCLSYRRRVLRGVLGERADALRLCSPGDGDTDPSYEWSCYGFAQLIARHVLRDPPRPVVRDAAETRYRELDDVLSLMGEDFDPPRYLRWPEFGFCGEETIDGDPCLTIVMHSLDSISDDCHEALEERRFADVCGEYRILVEGRLDVYTDYERQVESRK